MLLPDGESNALEAYIVYPCTSLRGDGCSCSASMNFWMIDLSSIPRRMFPALMSMASETLVWHHIRSRDLPVCIKCASVCR